MIENVFMQDNIAVGTILFIEEQRDAPSFRSGFTSPAKTCLKMRLIMKKSSGIARYVHPLFKNSVEYAF